MNATIFSIDELLKSRVKPYSRTIKGKLQRVGEYERRGEKKGLDTKGVTEDFWDSKEHKVKYESKEIVNRMGQVMKLFKQKKEYTCGPASIRIALSEFGKSYSEEAIAKIAKTTASKGTDSSNLIKAIRSYGVNVIEYKNMRKNYSINVLRHYAEAKKPIIISWLLTKLKGVEKAKNLAEMKKNEDDYEHYSVVSGVTDTHIKILEPYEKKELNLPIKYFMERWWDSEDKRWFIVLESASEKNE